MPAVDYLPRRSIAAPPRRPTAPSRPQTWLTICHPVWQFGYGGLERQLAQQAPRLADAGIESVLVIRSDGCEPQQPAPLAARVITEPAAAGHRWADVLAGHLRETRADLLHLRGLAMLSDGVAAARLAGGVPVIFGFHGLERAGARLGWFRKRGVRAALRQCAARLAVSGAARDWIADQAGLARDEFEIIPNGVDTEWFAPTAEKAAVRQRLGLPVDRLIVLCVGNIKPIKGHAVLFRALASLGGAAADITTVLVGHDYDPRGTTAALAAAAGHDVRRVGLQPDVRPWYSAADLVVLPSLWEGLSNALLEALACGLPVVATRVGGTTEVIRDGDTGRLVEPGDAAALAAALRDLIADAPRRAALGQRARQAALRDWRIEGTTQRLAALYARVARGTEASE